MLEDFITIYSRDLERLKYEIELVDESVLWKTKGSVKNSAGNLALHLIGNLNTYIANPFGQKGYIRDREAEFNSKGIAKSKIIADIIETKQDVVASLEKMTINDLQQKYPDDVFGYEMTNSFFLIHLAAHLSYHLGQINYLRRVLEEDLLK
jgi:uncharacterized damage-inducible protein DinB